MKKTILTALLMLSVMVLSAVGITEPQPEEKSCVYGWQETCQDEWRCHGFGMGRHCDWEEVCSNEWVCIPETDTTEINDRLTVVEGRGDSTGISKCDVWRYFTGEIEYDNCMKSKFSFLDYLKPTFDRLDKVYTAIYGKESVNGWESGLQDDVRKLKAEVLQLKQQCNN